MKSLEILDLDLLHPVEQELSVFGQYGHQVTELSIAIKVDLATNPRPDIKITQDSIHYSVGFSAAGGYAVGVEIGGETAFANVFAIAL